MDVVVNPRMAVTVKIRRSRRGFRAGASDEYADDDDKELIYPVTVSNVSKLDSHTVVLGLFALFINLFNASCSKLLLLEGFSAILL